MKFTVTMKDPDTLYDAILGAVTEELGKSDLPADERALLAESRTGKVSELCDKWFEHREYLMVEIDTEAQTCTVMPVQP